jgi:hypothetical protein
MSAANPSAVFGPRELGIAALTQPTKRLSTGKQSNALAASPYLRARGNSSPDLSYPGGV